MSSGTYINEYTVIKKQQPSSVRNVLRSTLLDILSLNVSELSDSFNEPRIQFLYIHHIFKDEELALESLIKSLSKKHTFISFSLAVEKLLNGTIDQPYIVFSSDDGLKNNISAAKIFSSFGISACFFINPFIIGQQDYKIIADFCKQQLHFPPVEFMNWEEVNQLQQMGHEIGSHTMKHINVAATSPEAVKEDIFKSYEILTQRCGEQKHFAYPYGRFFHFNEVGRKAVFEAGFQSCSSAERGCHINHTATLKKEDVLIRRDHIILDWKLDHILYFLLNNARKTDIRNNLFPWL